MSILGMSISKKLACSLIVLPEVPKSGRGGGLKTYPWMGDADGAGDARTGKQWGDIRHQGLQHVHQNHGAQPGLPTPLLLSILITEVLTHQGQATGQCICLVSDYAKPFPTKVLSLFSQITRKSGFLCWGLPPLTQGSERVHTVATARPPLP